MKNEFGKNVEDVDDDDEHDLRLMSEALVTMRFLLFMIGYAIVKP